MRVAHVVLKAIAAPALALLVSSSVLANPPSWSSFDLASFDGIYVAAFGPLANHELVVSLDSAPTITLGTQTYDVNWIQAFFVVSQDQNTDFIATGSSFGSWSWESNDNPGRIAGWFTDGPGRVHPGGDQHFQFATYDVTGNDVLYGFHVGYQSGNTELTGWYKGETEVPPLPEPSSLVALAAGLVGFVRLRKRA